jgi:hypothetical protein
VPIRRAKNKKIWDLTCPRPDTHLTYMIDIALTMEFSRAAGDGPR